MPVKCQKRGKRIRCPFRNCEFASTSPHKLVRHLYYEHSLDNATFERILQTGMPLGLHPAAFDAYLDALVKDRLDEGSLLPPVLKRDDERYQEIGSDEIG